MQPIARKMIWKFLHIFPLVLAILLKNTSSSLHSDLKNCHLNVTGDDSLQFDFTSISEGGWRGIKFEGDEGKELYLFLNICNNLIPKGIKLPCPNKNTLICLMEKINGSFVSYIEDIGSAFKNKIFSQADGALVIELEGDSKCSEENNYSTMMRFQCPNADVSEPLITREDCLFLIRWDSPVGCPVQEVVVEDTCIVAQTSHRYDLRSLRHKSYYMVKDGADVYLVNVCGVVKNSMCSPISSVCLRTNNSHHVLTNSSKSILRYSLQRGLTLEYKDLEGKVKTVISVICAEGVTKPILELISKDKGILQFSLKTAAVCVSSPVSCNVFQNGTNYYLSALHKQVDNWEIPSMNGKNYLLNICGGLNSMPEIPCTGGSVAACLWDPENNEGINLGSRETLTVENKEIRLTYTNGAPCGSRHYNLEIRFFCSLSDINPEVSSDGCDHKIVWYTSAACPLKFATGKDCQLKESYSKLKFNFSLLQNTSEDYVQRLKTGEAYRTNLCGPLVHPCNKEKNASVCWADIEGRQLAIGRVSREPLFTNGKFSFVMEGEPCHKNFSKSVVTMEMTCDDTGLQKGPKFVTENGRCEYLFEWKTDIVCIRKRVPHCIYKVGGLIYDLSSLTNLSENYEVKVNSTVIYINICQSLVREPKSFLCPPDSASCLINRSNSAQPEVKNLGRMNENNMAVIEDGSLILRYGDGDICKYGLITQTILQFICDKGAPYINPELKSINNCVYKFLWKTKAACPLRDPSFLNSTTVPSPNETKQRILSDEMTLKHAKPPGNKDMNCMVVSPSTKTLIDLSILKGKDWFLIGESGQYMTLSVCKSLGSACPGSPSSGLCQVSGLSYTNLGDANADLKMKNNLVYLIYKGSGCRTTKIEFICDKKDSGPILAQSTNCSTLISWKTPLVCHDQLTKLCCRGEGAPLCQLRGNHVVKISNKEVFLSVCHPLEPASTLNCPKGSSACMATHDLNSYINEVNLGYPYVSPKVESPTSITLEYFGGDRCDNQHNESYSSTIHFVCDKNAGKGHPEYLSQIDGCEFHFEWRTNLLCNSKPRNYTACTLENVPTSSRILSKFHALRDESVEVVGKNSGNMYKVSMCKGGKSECSADICVKRDGLWDPVAFFSKESFSGNVTEMRYEYINAQQMSSECGVRLLLICYHSSENPEVSIESQCNITISWKSKFACLNEAAQISIKDENSSVAGIVVGGILTAGAVLVGSFFLFRFLKKSLFLRNTFHGQFRYSKKQRVCESPRSSINEDSSINELLFSL